MPRRWRLKWLTEGVDAFVCSKTRAVHLDLITDLTLAVFISCYERFIVCLILCERLYNDNGTIFATFAFVVQRRYGTKERYFSIWVGKVWNIDNDSYFRWLTIRLTFKFWHLHICYLKNGRECISAGSAIKCEFFPPVKTYGFLRIEWIGAI